MSGLLSPGDFWVASGHHLCDVAEHGRLVGTPELWRAFLARPELMPPEEACAAERALHAALMEAPLQPVEPARLAALADADARENFGQFLAFRDRVAAQPTLEAAWLALYREGVAGVPPILLQMLTHLVARSALEGEGDPFALRAGELLYRAQRVGIHQGATLLADEEVVEMRGRDGGFGALGNCSSRPGRRRGRSSSTCWGRRTPRSTTAGRTRMTSRSTSPRAATASAASRACWNASSATCSGRRCRSAPCR